MFKSFQRQLVSTYLLIIFATLLVTGIVLMMLIKNIYYDSITSSLLNETRLVSEIMAGFEGAHQEEASAFAQQVSQTAGANTDTRVTIINRDGKVLGDSMYDPATLDLHDTRPEVYKALHGETGIATRYSSTAEVQMLYVALPLKEGAIQGVVRLSKPLPDLNRIYRSLLYVLLLAMLLTGLVAVAASFRIADYIARPVKKISQTLEEITRGDLKQRLHIQEPEDMSKLSQVINNMAESLETNINEISSMKNRLEAVLDNTVNGIFMVDREGLLMYVNPVACRLLGLCGDYMGRKHVEVIRNYDLVAMIDGVKSSLRPVKKVIVFPAGGERLLETNAVPLLDRQDMYSEGVLVVLNDITELKKLEQVRRDFVANVSHELKTPIATISGFAETLKDEGCSSPEHAREFSSIIYYEAQRLSRIVNGLLELSRLESGKADLHLEEVNLVDIICNAINIIEQGQDRSANIVFKQPDEPAMVEGDWDLLVQVMLNLLDNAVKYSPKNSPIEVKLEDRGEELKVLVSDQGEGIPEQEVSRVFERFYRVDKARSRKTGGTGLGLAIVKHLVENHYGRVGVESTYGQGTTFSFTLPRRQPRTEEA